MASPEEQLHKAVWDVLGEIKQEALVTPDNEWILISTPTDERWRAVRYLAKLGSIKAREHTPLGSVSAMKLVQEMNGRVYKPNAYKVEILQPKFDETYKNYRRTENPESEKIPKTILDYIKEQKLEAPRDNQPSRGGEAKMFWITYQGRSITLNTPDNKYLINKLQFFRDNELFFQYIFNKAGANVTKKEISEATGKTVDFNKFVDAIGFKGELRRAFFDVAKSAIRFINELTAKDLEDKGVDTQKFNAHIKKLKKI